MGTLAGPYREARAPTRRSNHAQGRARHCSSKFSIEGRLALEACPRMLSAEAKSLKVESTSSDALASHSESEFRGGKFRPMTIAIEPGFRVLLCVGAVGEASDFGEWTSRQQAACRSRRRKWKSGGEAPRAPGIFIEGAMVTPRFRSNDRWPGRGASGVAPQADWARTQSWNGQLAKDCRQVASRDVARPQNGLQRGNFDVSSWRKSTSRSAAVAMRRGRGRYPAAAAFARPSDWSDALEPSWGNPMKRSGPTRREPR